MKKRYWIPTLILSFVGWLLYPQPSTGFLIRVAPILEGRMTGLRGSSIAFMMDPRFYYQFTIEPDDLRLVLNELELQPSGSQDYYITIMQGSHGPFFWHHWWWQPKNEPGVTLYEKTRKGNHVLFLHHPATGLVHLSIQNT